MKNRIAKYYQQSLPKGYPFNVDEAIANGLNQHHILSYLRRVVLYHGGHGHRKIGQIHKDKIYLDFDNEMVSMAILYQSYGIIATLAAGIEMQEGLVSPEQYADVMHAIGLDWNQHHAEYLAKQEKHEEN